MKSEIFNTGSLEYLICYPDDYVEGERRPVLFFLHGAGTRGGNISRLQGNVFFGSVAKHVNFPFVIVAPHCPEESTWFDHFEQLKKLYTSLAEADFADPDRIYIMGLSMGGYGAWQLAMSCPEYTAAAVPICGGGMYWNAARLKNLPIWAHHGEIDNVVLLAESEKMVNAINAQGGNARLTVYEGVAHPAWPKVYASWEVFEWLLSHKRAGAKIDSSEYNDRTKFG